MNNLLQGVKPPYGAAVNKFLGIGLFLLLVFTNFISVEAQQAEPQDAFTTTSCADFRLPAAWATSPRVQCGYLSVPEDHNAPGGNEIQLGVVILKSSSSTPLADPLFIAQGGPGASTIDTYTKLIRLDTPLGASRDIVLWDQRGTLFSTPNLLCSEFLDATIPTLDQILTPDENERLALQAAQACRDRLDGQGINLSAYDSLQNAADIEALRQALGYEKINYYGVSYGTLLGLHFARLFPDSLRSLILDAVVPPQTNFLLNAGQSMTRSFNELFQACEANPECNSAYPNLEQVFLDVLDRLDREPASVQVFDGETGSVYETLIDGDLFQSTIFQLLYPTEFIPFLPKIIMDASEGNFDFLANAILPLIIFDRTISEGMYFSVICAEDADYNASDIDTSGLPDRIAEAEARDLVTFLRLCQTWDVAPLSAEEDNPVSSPVRTLLLSGRFDPITPPAYASQVKETLPNSFGLVFPNGGHGQAFGGDCQDQILLSFLNDPDQAPDASCVDSEISFVTPRDFILFPPLATLFNQDFGALFQNLFWGGTILLVILLQLSTLPVFLIIYFVERQRKRPINGDDLPAAPAAGPQRDSIWVRISPVWPVLFAFLAIFILASLVVIIAGLIATNNPIIFFGLPSSSRFLLLFSLFLLAITIVMVLTSIGMWIRPTKSLPVRIYYSLIALAAGLGIVAFAQLSLFSIF